MSKPTPAAMVALVALIVALGGTAVADPAARVAAKIRKSDGKRIVKVIPRNSLTGTQIDESKLTLPKPTAATLADRAIVADTAATAASADRATTAANADSAADAAKLGGKDSAAFAGAGDLKFAIVNAAGDLMRQRGGATDADIVDAAEDTYRVEFSADVGACAYTATPTGAATSDTLAVETGTSPTTVRVDADSSTDFHLQVIC